MRLRICCEFFQDRIYRILRDVILESRCDCIALSGGIDTSLIALIARFSGLDLRGFISMYLGGIPRDIYYASYLARVLGIELEFVPIDPLKANEIAEKVVECIGRDRIDSHGDGGCIEIRNDIVFYSVIEHARRKCKCIYTGSGGDELFAGYTFMLHQRSDDLESIIERYAFKGRYPELEIAECLGVRVISPYLDKRIIDLALEIPVECLRSSSMKGKEILRRILEERGLELIASREKTPAESGSGTKIFCRSSYDQL